MLSLLAFVNSNLFILTFLIVVDIFFVYAPQKKEKETATENI